MHRKICRTPSGILMVEDRIPLCLEFIVVGKDAHDYVKNFGFRDFACFEVVQNIVDNAAFPRVHPEVYLEKESASVLQSEPIENQETDRFGRLYNSMEKNALLHRAKQKVTTAVYKRLILGSAIARDRIESCNSKEAIGNSSEGIMLTVTLVRKSKLCVKSSG
jgi:hypothetical protein